MKPPLNYGRPKANLFIGLTPISGCETLQHYPSWVEYNGKKIDFVKKGRPLAEGFAFNYLCGEYHVTDKGYIFPGFQKDLPKIDGHLEMIPPIYQQLLNLQAELNNKHDSRSETDPHFLPELDLPSQPYGLPEDTIQWDPAAKCFYLVWCRKLYQHTQGIQQLNMPMKELHLEMYRQSVCDGMGDWKI